MTQNSDVSIKIKRYNPNVDKEPYYQNYRIKLKEEKINLLQALEFIYQEKDETLTFRRYCCGIQFCNSCRMKVNGKVAHACLTLLSPGQEMIVEPLPKRKVKRDLIVE